MTDCVWIVEFWFRRKRMWVKWDAELTKRDGLLTVRAWRTGEPATRWRLKQYALRPVKAEK